MERVRVKCLLLLVVLPSLIASAADKPSSRGPVVGYGNLPLAFESNQGQTDSQVKFLARGPGYSLFLTADGAVLSARPRAAREADHGGAVVRMKLLHSSEHASVAALGQVPGKTNYFIGNDPSRWHTGVPTFAKIRYQAIYPGVDLIYYGNQSQLEYDFVVAAGADPHSIHLAFEGVDGLQLDPDGNLLLMVHGGNIVFGKPHVYQRGSDGTREIAGRYLLTAGRQISFEVGAYDHSKPLVIDPVLQYSTYLGGSNEDGPMAIAIDSSGNAYVAGGTVSSDFPVTSGVPQATFGGQLIGCTGVPHFVCGDAFVAKVNPTGTALVYATYLGGNDRDSAAGVAVDASGEVFVAGQTQSANFPVTPGVFQGALAGTRNAFVAKLNAAGSQLLYSTYIGGSSKDGAIYIAIDSSGNAYLAGATRSSNFPVTTGAFQTTCKSCPSTSDGFVTKLNPTGTALVYSTFLGGTSEDLAAAIAVDGAGNAYVTGGTVSTDFPTQNPYQAHFAGGGTTCPTVNNQIDPHIFICGDAFVTKLNPTGSALVYSTYLGGSGDETGFGIAVDAAGNAYVSGGTNSTNFPTTSGVVQPAFGGGSSACNTTGIACGDAFVTKMNATGSAPIYSTYLGGANDDVGVRMAVDSSNNAHLTGITMSSNFPVTADAFQSSFAGGTSPCGEGDFCGDGWVATLNVNATALSFSSYIGGSGDDAGVAITSDSAGNDYATGATTSTNFPTTVGAFQTKCGSDGTCNGGLSDVFVAKISLPIAAASFSPASLSFTSQTVGTPSGSKPVTLTNSGTGTLAISSIASSGDYGQSNNCPSSLAPAAKCTINVTFTPSVVGTVAGNITVSDNASSASQMVNLTGAGAAPLLLSPPSMSFGTITVGTSSAPKTETLTNNTGAALSIGFTASGNYTANGSGTNPCGVSLGAHAKCTMSVIFTPTANGSINGAVTVTYNSQFSPLEVALSGTGSGAPTSPLTFSPAALSFTSQLIGTTSAVKVVTVTNSSTNAVTINTLSATGDYTATPGSTNPCGGALAAGAKCTFNVSFSPSVNATIKGAVVIPDSSNVSPQIYNLSGSGVLPLTMSPASLTFSAQSVGTISASKTVTLTNNQSTTLTLNGLSGTGDYSVAPGGTLPCGGTIAAHGKCTMNVTFAPTAKGTIKGVVTITHDANGSPQVVGLTGTGQ
jgi:Abnormal spindle-like microcephaly-assoc'd, ASPM-SPD-2-Hydin/Beta-propeller repeat/Cep192 domain 4